MKEPTGPKNVRVFAPLFETKARRIEAQRVGRKGRSPPGPSTQPVGARGQHLTELHFLLPHLFLGPLLFSDVDHSAHKFNELARCASEQDDLRPECP